MLRLYHKSIIFLFIPVIFLNLTFFVSETLAQSASTLSQVPNTTLEYYIRINKETAVKGYGITFHDLSISIGTSTLSDESGVTIKEIADKMPIPWQLNRISKIYQFEFNNKAAFIAKKPFSIDLKYDRTSNYFKQAYFFDRGTWRALPSVDYPDKKLIRAKINLPFSRLIILENKSLMTIGQATWYSYKNGLFAASPDFPSGSKLRVYNLAFGKQKFVDVVINDYGPNRLVHPNRVIDLDKVAFSKLAKTGAGAVDVLIEPLSLPANFRSAQKLSDIRAETSPQINAKSAYLISESKNNIIYDKNSKAVLPLASLSKIIAAKVFLDTSPDLKREIKYSIADEKKNYEYCKSWESARLKLAENDEIKINDLLISSLSASTNNTVETLVRISGLSRPAFIGKMNVYAKTLGATSTFFIEPSGLSPQNVSSVYEYAIIFNEAVKNKIIGESTTKVSYKISINGDKKKIKIYNTDKIVGLSKYKIFASKTGYLDEVGYNLALKAEKNGKVLVLVIMGEPTREQGVIDALDLLEFGFKQ
jgi:D-alanyl-D-alanine carboxypeptidase